MGPSSSELLFSAWLLLPKGCLVMESHAVALEQTQLPLPILEELEYYFELCRAPEACGHALAAGFLAVDAKRNCSVRAGAERATEARRTCTSLWARGTSSCHASCDAYPSYAECSGA
jgi:hypothetical protein